MPKLAVTQSLKFRSALLQGWWRRVHPSHGQCRLRRSEKRSPQTRTQTPARAEVPRWRGVLSVRPVLGGYDRERYWRGVGHPCVGRAGVHRQVHHFSGGSL